MLTQDAVRNAAAAGPSRGRSLRIALAFACLLLAACDDGSGGNLTIQLQQSMRALVGAGMPGVAVALVTEAGERVFTSGFANVDAGTALSGDTRFRIGGVSKAFNGAVVLSLVRDGSLTLNDTVEELAPELLGPGRDITVRQLLNHTSGLPDYTTDPAFLEQVAADPFRLWTPRELIAFVAEQPLLFVPGSEYRYSNSDNIVLAVVVEAVTGHSYADELNARVLTPLVLSSTFYAVAPAIPAPHATGYVYADGDGMGALVDVTSPYSPTALSASGAVVSTANDVARFMAAVNSGVVYGSALLEEARMTVPGDSVPPGPPGAGTNQAGLALYRYDLDCGTVWGHTGEVDPGWRAFVAATADGAGAVSVLVNGSGTSERARELTLQVQDSAVCLLLAQ